METNLAKDILEKHQNFENARHLVNIEGFSTPRVCHFLNRLVAAMDPKESYLEIGTFKGLTTFSAAYQNKGKKVIACDKFQFFGKKVGFGFRVKKAFAKNLLQNASDENANIEFYHLATKKLFQKNKVKGPVGIYFYDADHNYHPTKNAVLDALPVLSPKFILLMDDFDWEKVRRGTLDAIDEAGLKVLWQKELKGDKTLQGWWNGLGVFYLEKPGLF